MYALLAGAVLAASAFPVAAVGGLAAKAQAQHFEALPTELTTPPLAQTTRILTADGHPVTSLYGAQNRTIVPLSQIPAVMQHAVVAVEDSRFYQHNGVDLAGVLRAFVSTLVTSSAQGASTLTQQYVRQDLFLTAPTKAEQNKATAITPQRKLQEMRYALALEKKFSKNDIMGKYLNTVYFGNGAYGVAAAAKRYFSKTPQQLTPAEAALLAAYVKDPVNYPDEKQKAEDRRQHVLRLMHEQGYLTAAQRADAVAHPPVIKPSVTPNSCLPNRSITEANNWGFFCDYLRIWARQQPALGPDPEQRLNRLETGGYVIRLSLNPAMQAAAQQSVDGKAGRGAKLAQGIVLVEPGTGKIRAMAVNRTFGSPPANAGPETKRKYTENPLLTGDPGNQKATGFPSGSTFKMFTMLAALEQGMPLSTSYDSPDTYATPGKEDNGQPYVVKNASAAMAGRHNMWSGFGASVNTYFVQLEIAAKVTNVAKMAAKAGISFFPGRNKANSLATILSGGDTGAGARYALTFGQGSQTWPLYMANAYATVAARGKHCEPTPIESVTGPDGKTLDLGAPKCSQVFSPEVADAATDAARCPVGQSAQAGSCTGPGGATAQSVGARIGRPVAGKTGSTPENRQLWFAGFVPQLAGAAFSTDPSRPNSGAINGDLRVANDIFSETMAAAVQGFPSMGFTRPPDSLIGGSGGPVNGPAGPGTTDGTTNGTTDGRGQDGGN
ncbi:transglycosylase domain-containing protein [Fodinicola acaciae]|uniref:transglycosylase domain-containing protein n=1 Tax=Fodinicola acaciae TaxID=2681555 RepID=UPI0013D07EAA|nr:transglycosylase domain-containing protein [Fodinicola acaciae]